MSRFRTSSTKAMPTTAYAYNTDRYFAMSCCSQHLREGQNWYNLKCKVSQPNSAGKARWPGAGSEPAEQQAAQTPAEAQAVMDEEPRRHPHVSLSVQAPFGQLRHSPAKGERVRG